MVNDQVIIDNTHFREEDGDLVCYTNLPGGDKFEQVVSSKEAVQKNMIGWCNTVRDYLSMKERQAEEERLALKARRKSSLADNAQTSGSVTEQTSATPEPKKVDAKGLVLAHYEGLKEELYYLENQYEDIEYRIDAIHEEMDQLKPVIDAWKGVRGE